MQQAMSQAELASILRSRAIAVSDSHLEAVLRDAENGPQLATWAATHCTEDTLLTLDELELYDALERSGRDHVLQSSNPNGAYDPNPAAILPLREADLRAALAALEQSTAMINKQTDILRQQQDAVTKLAGSLSKSSPDEEVPAHHHQKRRDATRDALVADVERSARALGERVDDLSLQNRALAQRVQQTVDSLCRSDDTLLASLQKLGRALPSVPHAGDAGDEYERQQQQQQKSIARLRDICLHLIKLGVETIRTRLDRMYLEALQAGGEAEMVEEEDAKKMSLAGTKENVVAVQAELESLYAEILPVAQMSVEQQHLEPALRSLSGQNMKDLTRVLVALDYVDDCLAYLLEHIALLSVRIDTAVAHHATTEAILATARTELAMPMPQASSVLRKAAGDEHRRRLSQYGSPVRKRHSGGGSSLSAHLRTRSGTVGGSGSMISTAELKAQRRRSSGFGYDSFGADGMGGMASPIDQLLEALSLVLPIEEPASGEDASTAAIDSATCINARFLQTVLAERSDKAYGVASNAQEAFETATTDSLTDARRALALARASVLAESPFGDVQLVDDEIDGSMTVMADEVARLRERRAALEMELGQLRTMRSSRRDQIVKRWRPQE
ncbi:hypothetical protein SEPCBS57363_004507 [Sporothrix epigloea]|uniref:Uncharacterized protein n=1 Tax=Sporothrix epigloea TaxID=1892477 RepID=A0ABP0DVB1_9PEZI